MVFKGLERLEHSPGGSVNITCYLVCSTDQCKNCGSTWRLLHSTVEHDFYKLSTIYGCTNCQYLCIVIMLYLMFLPLSPLLDRLIG